MAHPSTSSSTRFSPRGAAVAELLTSLDALVRREVSRQDAGSEPWDRDAERIAAEVATSLSRLREDLRRHPLPRAAITAERPTASG